MKRKSKKARLHRIKEAQERRRKTDWSPFLQDCSQIEAKKRSLNKKMLSVGIIMVLIFALVMAIGIYNKSPMWVKMDFVVFAFFMLALGLGAIAFWDTKLTQLSYLKWHAFLKNRELNAGQNEAIS